MGFPDPSCPVHVSCAGSVSLSAPSPCGRLSRPPSTMGGSDSLEAVGFPFSLGSAYLLAQAAALSTPFRLRPTSVSGFPRPWLMIRMPCDGFARVFSARQELRGPPKFLTLLSTHTTLFVDPGRPSGISPQRSLCVGFWGVNTIAICIMLAHGAVSSFGECGLPCGLRGSLCTLQLCRSASFPSFTVATLGMSGWLGLPQQGLAPCKKRQASLGALTPTLSGGGRTPTNL